MKRIDYVEDLGGFGIVMDAETGEVLLQGFNLTSSDVADAVGEDFVCIPLDKEEDDYYEREYGPGNPWDAPGMRVSDFITGVIS